MCIYYVWCMCVIRCADPCLSRHVVRSCRQLSCDQGQSKQVQGVRRILRANLKPWNCSTDDANSRKICTDMRYVLFDPHIQHYRSCYHPFVFDTDTSSWRMLARHEWLLSVEARKASRNAASLRCQLAWRHVNGMPQSTCSVIVLENCMVPSCSIYSRHHECLATRHDWAWAYRTAMWDPVLPGRGRDSSLLCRGWSLCECWSSHWWCDAQSVSELMMWTIVNSEATLWWTNIAMENHNF